MYPHDNIFNIFYNIGRITPFQVKRCEPGLVRALPQNRYKDTGRTFIVERVEPKGKYGKAFGYCLVDGVRDDEYLKEYDPNYNIEDIAEIPCAGCGAWVLIDVPGHDIKDVFPTHKPDEVLPFGKYKGLTFREIYKKDAQYIYWLMDSDPYYDVDILGILGLTPNTEAERVKMLEDEYQRVFNKQEIPIPNLENAKFNFGKYKGLTIKEVLISDPNYIDWLKRNDIDF